MQNNIVLKFTPIRITLIVALSTMLLGGLSFIGGNKASSTTADDRAPDAADQSAPAPDGIEIDAGTERVTLTVDDLLLVAAESNIGTCLDVRTSSTGGSAGGCGFDTADPMKSWMVGEVTTSRGLVAFAAGLAPDGADAVTIGLERGSVTTEVAGGVWFSLLEKGAGTPRTVTWRSDGLTISEVAP